MMAAVDPIFSNTFFFFCPAVPRSPTLKTDNFRSRFFAVCRFSFVSAGFPFAICLLSAANSFKMRQLTEDETKTLFAKLANYTGRSLNALITSTDDASSNDRYVFRLHGSRVYYLRLSVANLATSIPRANLLSVGICVGKFTKTGKFRIHVTALEVIAPHARYKVWIKQNGEMPFMYGGNVVKAHVGRWSEDCPEHQGVVVFNMDDTPLVSAMAISTGVWQWVFLTCHSLTGLWRDRSIVC